MYQGFNFAQSGPGFGNKACPLSSPISRNYSVKAVTTPRLSDLGQPEGESDVSHERGGVSPAVSGGGEVRRVHQVEGADPGKPDLAQGEA